LLRLKSHQTDFAMALVAQPPSDLALVVRSPRANYTTVVETGVVCGGKATRTVEILNEDGTECISIGAASTTKTTEVCDVIAAICSLEADKIRLVKRVGSYAVAQTMFEEVASRVTALGIRSFRRPIQQYEHPILIIGAGLGGMQTMLKLKEKGRKDFICLEKLDDFGGHSWMVVANKYTKLQTEKGTYHVDYINSSAECPSFFKDLPYMIWPSRDQLLQMFRVSARKNGLYEHTRFCTSVEKVKPLPGKYRYSVQTVPTDSEEGGELLVGSAVMAWPGNLCDCNLIEFPGEDDFGGYIEYSSFGKMDFTKVKGKDVILYGHGAFTIENVRTLLEHSCKKVHVLCRKRNLCGMKVVSWFVAYSDQPVPGHVLMEAMQKMYDLAGFDAWTAHSVRTDANRSFAHISQKTVFGVTDIYFLAAYYGLMEVVEDEIKRLTHLCAHTKKGKMIECEVILKAVGTKPSFLIDKMLGLKELHGLWVNGDPLRPVVCNGMFVEARNFGSFSSGPGFATMVMTVNWFVDYPGDWEAVRGQLPVSKAGDTPAYVPSTTHLTPMFSILSGLLPMLGAAMGELDQMKTMKQRRAHPIKEYIASCKAEWDCYIRVFKQRGMITDDRPEPAYPYNEAMVEDWMDRTSMFWVQRLAQQQKG